MKPKSTGSNADSITEHDWLTYSCQWWSGCTNIATNEVHKHRLDLCNDRDETDADGDEITLLCVTHTAVLQLDVAYDINRLKRAARRCGGRAMCGSCQTPICAVGDILRVIAPLRATR